MNMNESMHSWLEEMFAYLQQNIKHKYLLSRPIITYDNYNNYYRKSVMVANILVGIVTR